MCCDSKGMVQALDTLHCAICCIHAGRPCPCVGQVPSLLPNGITRAAVQMFRLHSRLRPLESSNSNHVLGAADLSHIDRILAAQEAIKLLK